MEMIPRTSKPNTEQNSMDVFYCQFNYMNMTEAPSLYILLLIELLPFNIYLLY